MLAQQVQIEQLLRVLQAKCEDLEALKGDPAELQRTLALVEELTKKQQAEAAASTSTKPPGNGQKKPKQREKSGPTEQPDLLHEERPFKLDEADCVCPACGGELRPIEGQFEESEMIDVIDSSAADLRPERQL